MSTIKGIRIAADYSDEVFRVMKKQVERVLEECGLVAEGYAQVDLNDPPKMVHRSTNEIMFIHLNLDSSTLKLDSNGYYYDSTNIFFKKYEVTNYKQSRDF